MVGGGEEEGTVKNNSEVLNLYDNTKNSHRNFKLAYGRIGRMSSALDIVITQEGRGPGMIDPAFWEEQFLDVLSSGS